MFKRPNRLVSNYEFNTTRKFGKKLAHPLFVIWALDERSHEGPAKIGIAVSKKFHKSAVKRNRIKRMFREMVKSNLDVFKDGYWVVIHPKQPVLEMKYEEIDVEFSKAIQKVFVTS